GLEACRAQPLALIVLDVGLPDTQGFELFRGLRQITQAPVIFLTARGGEIDRVVGLEIGADDYITKPFSPRELTARVRAVLRRAQHRTDPAAPRAESSMPFSLDEAAYEIRYFGQLLELSRYEYRLLKILIAHPRRVYSREMLLELAWDDPEESFDRTVDTHIKTLRAKLRAVRDDLNPIKTHRSLGYSLSLES
ncbi:MAG: two-component system response regulator CreB, partial [Gammaproteobacteria bacterium]